MGTRRHCIIRAHTSHRRQYHHNHSGKIEDHHSESPPQGRIVVGDGARRGWRPSSRLLS
ncbi:unnamed protein product, partial [Musa hybrid cultivar]